MTNKYHGIMDAEKLEEGIDYKVSSFPVNYRKWASELWSKDSKEFFDEEAARGELQDLYSILDKLFEHFDALPTEIKGLIGRYKENGLEFKKIWDETQK